MTTTGKGITFPPLPLEYPGLLGDGRYAIAHRQLTEAYDAAIDIPFDDSSRLVFFSDTHRGDGSRADAFRANRGLFLAALTHYYREGFTYIEVGDGDELWKNRRFRRLRRAHARVYDLLQQFENVGRLHLLLGNHDIQGERSGQVVKDGILAYESAMLEHVKTGQRILLLHGHQADFESDRSFTLSRLVVRYIWRPLQLLGFGRAPIWGENGHNLSGAERALIQQVRAHKRTIESKILIWLQEQEQMVICGHTHRPAFAAYGSPPYFNPGSCLIPGQMTGLEIQHGQITMVRWSAELSPSSIGEALSVQREALTPSRLLSWFDHPSTAGA